MTKFLSPEGVRGETGNAAGDNPFHVDFSPRKGDFRGNSTRSLRVAQSAKPRRPFYRMLSSRGTQVARDRPLEVTSFAL